MAFTALLTLLIPLVLSAIPIVLAIVGQWIVNKKVGRPGWHTIVPYLSHYTKANIAGNVKNFWIMLIASVVAIATMGLGVLLNNGGEGNSTISMICILTSLPAIVVVIIMAARIEIGIARAFGKGAMFGLGLLLLPFLLYPILAWGNAEYEGETPAPKQPKPQKAPKAPKEPKPKKVKEPKAPKTPKVKKGQQPPAPIEEPQPPVQEEEETEEEQIPRGPTMDEMMLKSLAAAAKKPQPKPAPKPEPIAPTPPPQEPVKQPKTSHYTITADPIETPVTNFPKTEFLVPAFIKAREEQAAREAMGIVEPVQETNPEPVVPVETPQPQVDYEMQTQPVEPVHTTNPFAFDIPNTQEAPRPAYNPFAFSTEQSAPTPPPTPAKPATPSEAARRVPPMRQTSAVPQGIPMWNDAPSTTVTPVTPPVATTPVQEPVAQPVVEPVREPPKPVIQQPEPQPVQPVVEEKPAPQQSTTTDNFFPSFMPKGPEYPTPAVSMADIDLPGFATGPVVKRPIPAIQQEPAAPVIERASPTVEKVASQPAQLEPEEKYVEPIKEKQYTEPVVEPVMQGTSFVEEMPVVTEPIPVVEQPKAPPRFIDPKPVEEKKPVDDDDEELPPPPVVQLPPKKGFFNRKSTAIDRFHNEDGGLK